MKFNKLIPEMNVTDLKKSLDFYINIIGFKIEYERKEEKFVFISLGEAQIMLEEIDKSREKWYIGKLKYPFGNGINFQIEVENIDELYKRLKKANYEIKFDLEKNWYKKGKELLGNEEFLVLDPDGYLLRFFQDLGIKKI